MFLQQVPFNKENKENLRKETMDIWRNCNCITFSYIEGITKPALCNILNPGHHQACYLLYLFYIQGITEPAIYYFFYYDSILFKIWI